MLIVSSHISKVFDTHFLILTNKYFSFGNLLILNPRFSTYSRKAIPPRFFFLSSSCERTAEQVFCFNQMRTHESSIFHSAVNIGILLYWNTKTVFRCQSSSATDHLCVANEVASRERPANYKEINLFY